MQLVKFRKYIQTCLLSSALLVSAVIMAPLERVAAEEANKAKVADGGAEKTKNKADNDPKGMEKRKTQSELEKKLQKLHNLYVPMHWTDYASGMAIGGFDPLSYFFNEKSEIGDERFQYLWHGVTWQFSSEANLLAFKRTPSIYAPRYAGYDPYAISNGILAQGLPSIWIIEGGKLYLFHNQVNKYLWRENAKQIREKIEKNWQDLSLEIPRYKIF